MGDILADDPALLNAIRPKKHETLFGPSLGEISPGPAWTGYGKDASEGGKADELTQETVRAWIAKSKEVRSTFLYLDSMLSVVWAIIGHLGSMEHSWVLRQTPAERVLVGMRCRPLRGPPITPGISTGHYPDRCQSMHRMAYHASYLMHTSS
jgi:hypothetical protein